MGFLEKFVTNISKRLFGQTSCMHCLGSIRFVGLDVCIRSIIISPHLDVSKTTSESTSARVVMVFSIQNVVCSFRSCIGASSANTVITSGSTPVPSKAAGVKCSGTILPFMESIPGMYLSIYVIYRRTLSAKFWTTSNQSLIFRSLTLTMRENVP